MGWFRENFGSVDRQTVDRYRELDQAPRALTVEEERELHRLQVRIPAAALREIERGA